MSPFCSDSDAESDDCTATEGGGASDCYFKSSLGQKIRSLNSYLSLLTLATFAFLS